MNLTGKIYGTRGNGGSHGDVFTSPEVVRFMLDKVGYTADKDLSKYKILEPSCGCGDFLIEIFDRIHTSSARYGFDATKVMSDNVFACELDKDKLDICIAGLKSCCHDFTPNHFINGDFLLSEWDCSFDFIVGNPPYIRYENIPSDKRDSYKRLFSTFHYRCDIYVLFYEHSLKYLAVSGKHVFICSNRWLKNEYGRKLRNLISTCFHLEYLIDAETLDAFQETVLAYPAITVIESHKTNAPTFTAEVKTLNELASGPVYSIKYLNDGEDWNYLFIQYPVERLFSIEELGFNIGIGVATGADSVFISNKLPGLVEEELLMPIINARDLTGDTLNWKGRYLLNPYTNNGNLISLESYPKAESYLGRFRNELSNRHIVKNNRPWYSLIDKIKYGLVSQPKILLPDISGNKFIFVDGGNFYPAHNIYYISGKSEEELKILACILMSSSVRSQISQIANRMNGGLPRWQSQSIKKLRIPSVASIGDPDRKRLLSAYEKKDTEKIDNIVADLFSSKNLRPTRKRLLPVQKSLFESCGF